MPVVRRPFLSVPSHLGYLDERTPLLHHTMWGGQPLFQGSASCTEHLPRCLLTYLAHREVQDSHETKRQRVLAFLPTCLFCHSCHWEESGQLRCPFSSEYRYTNRELTSVTWHNTCIDYDYYSCSNRLSLKYTEKPQSLVGGSQCLAFSCGTLSSLPGFPRRSWAGNQHWNRRRAAAERDHKHLDE